MSSIDGPNQYTDEALLLFLDLCRAGIHFLSEDGAAVPVVTERGPWVYYPDFLIEGFLVLEVKGGVHEKYRQRLKDEVRERLIRETGLEFMSVENEQVTDPERRAGVVEEVKFRIEARETRLRLRQAAYYGEWEAREMARLNNHSK